MGFTTDGKFQVGLALVCGVIAFFLILLNNFYNFVVFMYLVVMTFVIFSMLMGVWVARLAPAMFINLRMGDKDKFGIFGRFNHLMDSVKGKMLMRVDVENYVIKHSGHEGLIKGIPNLMRGDTPMHFECTESEIVELPKTMTKNPEGYVILVDDEFRSFLGLDTKKKIAQLEEKLRVNMMYVKNLRKLIKSIQKSASQTNREAIEEASRTIDDLTTQMNAPLYTTPMQAPVAPQQSQRSENGE